MSLNRKMLRRIIVRSLRVRSSRTLIALGALTIAATLITAMLALYTDLERKLDKEFRSYGANIVVAARSGEALPNDAEAKAKQLLGSHATVEASGLAIATAKKNDGTTAPVVVVGTTDDVHEIAKQRPWWNLQGFTPSEPEQRESAQALIGSRVLQALDFHQPFAFLGRQLTIRPISIVHSGDADEDRVFLSLTDFERWTGMRPNLLEISYTGSSAETEAALYQLQSALANDPVAVRPVRQIVEAEGRVIRKTRAMMFACGLLIAVTVALCVGSTLTASVLERRRDFALMKALGASQSVVNGIFTAEALLLAAVAALVGYLAGMGVADLIGTLNFHAAITPRIVVFPVVLLITLAVALGSSLLPLAQLQGLEPAVILKGE
jgi:putative ABC transport system permease protein